MNMNTVPARYWLVGAIALTGIVTPACMHSPQEKGERFLSSGKQLFEQRNYQRAILAYRNAAQVMPKEAEPYYQMGVAYLASGDPAAAVAAFRKALERNPKHAGARLKLAQLMALTNDPQLVGEARERLKSLVTEDPTSRQDAVYSLSFTELKLGNIQQAASALEEVLSQDPAALNASTMLAVARLSANDPAAAEKALKDAVAAAPKSAAAVRVLGRFYLDRQRPAEAEIELRRSLELDPAYGPALLELASAQLLQNRKQEAEATLQRLSKLRTSSYRPAFALFLYQEGRSAEAIAEFERLAKDDPEDRAARTRLIAAYRALGRQRDAENVLGEALRRNRKDLDALLQRGELYLLAQKYAEAEADLNQVLKLNPNSAEVHYVIGKLNQARQQKLMYRAQLAEALRLNPLLLKARLELAEDLRTGNDPSGALAVLDAAPTAQKRTPAVMVQRNWVLWAIGDLKAMRTGIDQGLALVRSVELLLQDGMWKGRTNNPAGARAAAEEALRIDPENIQALELLARSYTAQRMRAAGVEKLKEHASRLPNSPGVQLYLARILMVNGDYIGARAALLAAKTAQPKDADVDKALVQLDVLEGKYQDATKRLDALSTADRDEVLQLWMGNLAVLNRNPNAAIACFRKAVATSPNDANAANNLAYLLAEHTNEFDEALQHAQKAVELAPEDPAYSDTLGWVMYRKGLYAPAVQHFERAVSKGENIVWRYHLAMAYTKAGSLERGRATLTAALKKNPNVPEARLAREVVAAAR